MKLLSDTFYLLTITVKLLCIKVDRLTGKVAFLCVTVEFLSIKVFLLTDKVAFLSIEYKFLEVWGELLSSLAQLKCLGFEAF